MASARASDILWLVARRAKEPVRVADAGRLARPPGAGALGDLYHRLLTSSWTALLGFVLVAYVIANLAFASIYYLDGGVVGAHAGSFSDMFFFSVQTMATIGYGKMTPASFLTNALVSFEALFGLVGLALMTGMMFAKFSLPSARVRFSRYAVVSRRDGVPSLMFRMANMRANRIVEAQIHVVFARNENTSEGERLRRFYDLPTTRDRSALFALTWTAVHPLVEGSPMAGQSAESLRAMGAEVIVSLTGLDETFSQTVHARKSYGPADIRWGARLSDIMTANPDGTASIDYSRFDEIVSAGL
jgi:inward rectifier potassium channel